MRPAAPASRLFLEGERVLAAALEMTRVDGGIVNVCSALVVVERLERLERAYRRVLVDLALQP